MCQYFKTLSLFHATVLPRSLSPSSVWRRTTESTSESQDSFCLLAPPLTWMVRLSTRLWQPSSLLRSTTWRWTLVRSLPSGKRAWRWRNKLVLVFVWMMRFFIYFSVQYNCNCCQYWSSWHSSGRSGHHGHRADLRRTADWWHHPHHSCRLVPVSILQQSGVKWKIQ